MSPPGNSIGVTTNESVVNAVRRERVRTAALHTRRVCQKGKYDFLTGIFDDGGDRQKHYYEFELRHRLREAGFTHLRIRKVRYPWDETVSGFECFPGKPKLWDWLVCAGRPDDELD